MSGISSDEVRVPRRVREAVARHETVVVYNRERAVMAVVHPDDAVLGTPPIGRPLRNVVEALRLLPAPDSAFAEDMSAVVRAAGAMPEDAWAPS